MTKQQPKIQSTLTNISDFIADQSIKIGEKRQIEKNEKMLLSLEQHLFFSAMSSTVNMAFLFLLLIQKSFFW